MIEFRTAAEADLPLLERIELACFHDPWSADMLLEELRMSMSNYQLMFEDGELVGYYAYMHILDEAHILNVAVLPDKEGRGLGRLMMQHLLSTLPEDIVAVTLEVRRSNERAIRLYERAGFLFAGIRKGYYMDGEDACIYWWRKGESC